MPCQHIDKHNGTTRNVRIQIQSFPNDQLFKVHNFSRDTERCTGVNSLEVVRRAVVMLLKRRQPTRHSIGSNF